MSRRKIIVGDKYENLEVIENLGLRDLYNSRSTFWRCKCLLCGNTIDIPQRYLGVKKNCGCCRHLPKKEIMPGEKFGKLTVLGHKKLLDNGHGYVYLCECNCDRKTHLYIRGSSLRDGTTRSCGCIHDELLRENAKEAYKRNFVNNTNVPKVFSDVLQKNNTSGYRGVSWHKGSQKWHARVAYRGKSYSLGYYDNPKEASEIVAIARRNIKKDFLRWYDEESKKDNKGKA